MYPNLIQIADASNLSASGWKGDLHLADLLKNFDPHKSKYQGFRILVLDEFDKIWLQRSGDNEYFNIMQSQLLKLFEHDEFSSSMIFYVSPVSCRPSKSSRPATG